MSIPFVNQQVVEVIVRGDIASGGSGGRPTYNTLHFRRTATLANINKAAVDTAFQAAIGAKLILALNNRWSQAHNSVRCINDAQDPFLTVTHINAGAVAGDGMTSRMVSYFLFRTSLRQGSYRGHQFFGPLSESDTTLPLEDIFNVAGLARQNALAAAILAGFTDAGGDIWVPCVLSRKQSKLKKNNTTVVTTDISQALVNKRITELKSRRVAVAY